MGSPSTNGKATTKKSIERGIKDASTLATNSANSLATLLQYVKDFHGATKVAIATPAEIYSIEGTMRILHAFVKNGESRTQEIVERLTGQRQ